LNFTGAQVPTLPGSAHAWHWPMQASLQHTPSTQLPSMHSALLPHVTPRATFGAHCPILQKPVMPQSASTTQVLAQVPLVPDTTHFDGLQSVWLARQTPPPLHTLPVSTVPTHDGVPHSTSGSLPSTMKLQVPVEPATPDLVAMHASHEPLQARSQHTPSAQLPLAHSGPAPHAVPLVFAVTQAEPAQ
jgi:hypothetical protein